METSYENTVKIVKEALQQQIIQFVVNQLPTPKIQHPREGSQSSNSDSYGDSDSQNSNNNNGIEEPSRRGGNAIEQYQSMQYDSEKLLTCLNRFDTVF